MGTGPLKLLQNFPCTSVNRAFCVILLDMSLVDHDMFWKVRICVSLVYAQSAIAYSRNVATPAPHVC